ncbi:Excisionase-like protein [Pseudomonas sp. NFACC02]|uniref:excisionase n=1 Tax=Pseudomonas sp. NFACC02 TaxID=1566250 RepID=UPI0008BB7862|nr:excisionase [Pseudomonas sp. NFACC02]SEQ26285.1 Excisionase-like protein [Pseudomonas sp. NFACC02]
MPKMTLEEWATEQFKTPPSMNTLRTWAREGRISPTPVKHGKRYYVDSDACYREPDKQERIPLGGSLISRIESARHGAKAA